MSIRALLGETIIDMPTCDSPEPSGGLFTRKPLFASGKAIR